MFVAAALAFLAACAREPEPRARNLLLVTIDTLRADHLSAYGYARPTSPGIDRLARRGVLFEQAHAVSAWTLPSVVSIMTSLYPSAHGCQGGSSSLPPVHDTLAEHLRQAGFRTGAVVNQLYLHSRRGLAQGFEHYDEELVRASHTEAHESISSPAVTDRALAWLEERAGGRDERWFLWLHYFDPHSHYLSHAGITERYGDEPLDRYDGEITFTDLHVGRLLDGLERLGMAGETAVVLVADHGEEFRDHGGIGHRATLYQEVLRVPLIVSAPGLPQLSIAESVGIVDLFPTICALLAVQPPVRSQGTSLLPLMLGRSAGARVQLAEMRNRSKRDWDALVADGYKLLHDVTADRKLLFDLRADPLEREDLSASRPELVAQLWARMRAEIERSRALAAEIGGPAEIELTPEEARDLDRLGYGGEQ